MTPRQEAIDESILPIRSNRKRSKRQDRSRFRLERRHITVLAYSLLGFFSFLFFFLMELPTERMSGRILEIVSRETQMDWDASAVDFSLLFGPKITFHKLSVNPRAQNPSMDILSHLVGDGLTIERLSFRPNLWQLMPIPWLKVSQPAGSFSAEIFGSEISGSFIMGMQMLYLNIDAAKLNFKNIPQISRQLNLEGVLNDFHLDLSAPRSRLGISTGEARAVVEKIKFDPSYLSQAAFIKSLGQLNLGKLNIKSKIKNGQLSISEFTVSGKDTDLEVKLEGDIRLNDNIMSSDMNLILWLTPAQKLLSIFDNPLLTSIVPFDKKPNNSYALRIQGNFIEARTSPYKGS